MKKLKLVFAFLLACIILTMSFPVTSLALGAGGNFTTAVDIYWIGSDPTPITIYREFNEGGIYEIKSTYVVSPYNVTKDGSTLLPNNNYSWYSTYRTIYEGNGKWHTVLYMQYELYESTECDNDIFVAVSRSTIDGLWYCDKWDWSNLLYQPGQYVDQSNVDSQDLSHGSFMLTSSAAHTNNLTINRSLTNGAPAIDTTYDIYRQYACDSNNYQLITSVTLPAIANSVTVNGLYDGTYAAVQRALPTYYSDDATDTFKNVTKAGKGITMTGSGGSVTFNNSYSPPTYYNIGVSSSLTGGTITPNKTSAVAGDTVGLTITPDADKQMKSGTLKYTDSSGDHPISGSSFTMPSSDVTISAQFEPRQYTVGIGSFGGGTISPDKSTAASGDTVNLTVTPANGKHLVPGSLCYKYGTTTVPITDTSFVMPASNVTVYADFDPKDRTVSAPAIANGAVTADKTTAIAGDTVNLTVTPQSGYHKVPGSLKYSYGTNTVPIAGTSFIMPDANVAVSCAFDKDIAVTTTSLPNGNIGVPYASAVSISNGSVGYTCSATGLPGGLTINPSTGAITGTPTDAGQFTVKVTATDANDMTDSTTATIPLTIYDATNCYLTDLTVDGGTLTPSFDRGKVAFSVDFGGKVVTSARVTATAADPGDTLTIGGKAAASGAATTVSLNNGANLIPVVVTSPDGLSQKSYILSVNGTVSNADLGSLSLSAGSLAFDPAVTTYYVTVGSDATSINLTAAASDTKAVMLINGIILSQGGTMSLPLSVGENTVTLMVIAQDATSKTYTVTISRGSSDATLSGLTLSAGTLSPSFSQTAYAYTATVTNSVSSLTVTPVKTDSGSTVTVNGSTPSTPVSLSVGSNTIAIVVTGKDGVTKKTYTITVTRQAAITITNPALPVGIVGQAYSVTLTAAGGTGAFTWSASGLPAVLALNAATGKLTGTLTDADVGMYAISVTATDTKSVTGTASLTLTVRKGCGGGAYLIVSDGDSAYTGSYTMDGIPTLTVNAGVSGLTYFGVNITKVTGHSGLEVCVFVQIRNGQQIGFSASKGDFDTTGAAYTAFNVKAGDIVRVYIVDNLSNAVGSSPTIL